MFAFTRVIDRRLLTMLRLADLLRQTDDRQQVFRYEPHIDHAFASISLPYRIRYKGQSRRHRAANTYNGVALVAVIGRSLDGRRREVNKIEFNLLNPYLIEPVAHLLMFDHDEKRVP